DEVASKHAYDYAATEDLKEMPQWSIDQYQYYVDQNAAFISVVSPIPNALAGVDSKKMQAVMQVSSSKLQFFREHTMGNKTQWTIVAASNPSWAKKLFPDLQPQNAVEKLWDAIFNACRVTIDNDPVEAWVGHNQYLSRHN